MLSFENMEYSKGHNNHQLILALAKFNYLCRNQNIHC